MIAPSANQSGQDAFLTDHSEVVSLGIHFGLSQFLHKKPRPMQVGVVLLDREEAE